MEKNKLCGENGTEVRDTIVRALGCMKDYDWYWFAAENYYSAYRYANAVQCEFTRLAESLPDPVHTVALKQLWDAKCECAAANFRHSDDDAKEVYNRRRRELIAVLLPDGDPDDNGNGGNNGGNNGNNGGGDDIGDGDDGDAVTCPQY